MALVIIFQLKSIINSKLCGKWQHAHLCYEQGMLVQAPC